MAQADRSRKISKTPSLVSWAGAGAVVPVGIQASHGTNQSRLPKPSTRKNGRQPKRLTTVPPTSMPMAGPNESPDIIAALPIPRRPSTKKEQLESFEYAG